MRVDGNSVILMPGVAFSVSMLENGGNSSICAWPPFSCSSRVASVGTVVQVTLSR